jgi:hypothetical protein
MYVISLPSVVLSIACLTIFTLATEGSHGGITDGMSEGLHEHQCVGAVFELNGALDCRHAWPTRASIHICSWRGDAERTPPSTSASALASAAFGIPNLLTTRPNIKIIDTDQYTSVAVVRARIVGTTDRLRTVCTSRTEYRGKKCSCSELDVDIDSPPSSTYLIRLTLTKALR